MKQPQIRMWIDARHEMLSPGKRKSVSYYIENLHTDEVKLKLYEAIGNLVYEIRVVPDAKNSIEVVYQENYLTVTFMDYRLQLKGLHFKREGS